VAYYSFVAIAKQAVGIPKPMLMLDAGVNVFTVAIDDLDGFLGQLKHEGVTVQQMNLLDAHQPGQPEDLEVEGLPRELGGADGVES
jgi:hypothetical protein